MIDKIITASGAQYETDYFVSVPNEDVCFLRILNMDLNTVREVFSNPNETSCLIYCGVSYFGYIHLDNIFQEGNGIKVVLSK